MFCHNKGMTVSVLDLKMNLSVSNSQPARAVWFDRKKYVTMNFFVQKPRDVQVEIQADKLILW